MQRAGRLGRRRIPALLVAMGVLLLSAAGFVGLGGGTANAATLAYSPSNCVKAGDGLTCHNDSPLGVAWNPKTNRPAPVPREVTVSQTEGLSSQVVTVSWKYFSPTTSTRSYIPAVSEYPVEIFECKTANPTSIDQCFGSNSYPTKTIPSDTNFVQAVTGVDSTRSVQFGVLTKSDEISLGCNATTACSLLVLPWSGGNPAPSDTQLAPCFNHAGDAGFNGNATVSTTWEANHCAWNSRIVVPLHFAPSADDCAGADAAFDIQGSPLDSRAMDQWRTGLCSGASHLNIDYTDLSEYQARDNVLQGNTDVALTTQAATDPARPVVYAPVTNTAMALAYYVDDPATGNPITTMKLTPRLLAKMLTQSYAVLPNGPADACAAAALPCAPEVDGNPRSVIADPEFRALNPAMASVLMSTSLSRSFPTVAFGDEDSTYKITSWLASDAEAAAFAAGSSAGGTHINTAYLPSVIGTLFPTSRFVASDPGSTQKVACSTEPGAQTCVNLNQGMQMTWFPVSGLRNVAKQQLISKDSGRQLEANCGGVAVTSCDQHAADAGQVLGARISFAITSYADAEAYGFPTALIQTRAGTYVEPTPESITAADAHMTTDANGVASLDYANLSDGSTYPWSMPTYAMLPTCGLSAAKIASIGSFLRYVASDAGQHTGRNAGDLPLGYVPLTPAQRAQTVAAIGKLTTKPCPIAGGGGFGGGNGGSGGNVSVEGTTATAAPSEGTVNPSSATKETAFATVKSPTAGVGEILLPLLLGLGGFMLVGSGPLAYLAGTGRLVKVGVWWSAVVAQGRSVVGRVRRRFVRG